MLLPCDSLPLDLPTHERVAYKASQSTLTIPSHTSDNGERSDDEYGIAIPYPPAVHDPDPVAEMDIPHINIEEQRDLSASEDMARVNQVWTLAHRQQNTPSYRKQETPLRKVKTRTLSDTQRIVHSQLEAEDHP